MSGAERELEAMLASAIEEGWFPSFQALVVADGTILFEAVAGFAVREPEPVLASRDTLYDLASLTKPLVTSLLALRLAEEGMLPLGARASNWLEELATPPWTEVTVLDLLVHRAGFQAWAPLYLGARPSLQRYASAAIARGTAHAPGTKVLYSDLAYLVLGALLERVTSTSFADLAEKHVLRHLGGEDLRYLPPAALKPRIAATERGNVWERGLAGADAGDERFRRHLLWGEVHDGNAHGLGGVAPHAGLFGTARAVARAAAAYLPSGPLLAPAGRAPALHCLTEGEGPKRTAAFEVASAPGTAASGGALAVDAVGHTGFTGTSLWLEPARQRIYALLTNRVHPEAKPVAMNEIRRRFHALASRL